MSVAWFFAEDKSYRDVDIVYIDKFCAKTFLDNPTKGKQDVYRVLDENGIEIMRGQVILIAGKNF